MWIALGVLLAVGWLTLRLFIGVASFAVHFLLAAAVLSLVGYFVRGYFGRRDAPAI